MDYFSTATADYPVPCYPAVGQIRRNLTICCRCQRESYRTRTFRGIPKILRSNCYYYDCLHVFCLKCPGRRTQDQVDDYEEIRVLRCRCGVEHFGELAGKQLELTCAECFHECKSGDWEAVWVRPSRDNQARRYQLAGNMVWIPERKVLGD